GVLMRRLGLLLLLLLLARASSAAPAPATESAAVVAVRHTLDSLARADAFSGAVLIARGDRTLLREARGWASRERHEPNRPETRFNLGSINKLFTRVAIEQLAAAGKLRLGDTIARYLPDYPADKGRRITIEQLDEHPA